MVMSILCVLGEKKKKKKKQPSKQLHPGLPVTGNSEVRGTRR